MNRSNWLGLPEHELLADGEPSSASAGDNFSRLTRNMSQKVRAAAVQDAGAVHALARHGVLLDPAAAVTSFQRKRFYTRYLSAHKHIPQGCILHFKPATNTDAAPVQAMRSNVVVQFYRELVAVSTLAMHSTTSTLLQHR